MDLTTIQTADFATKVMHSQAEIIKTYDTLTVDLSIINGRQLLQRNIVKYYLLSAVALLL